MQQNTRVAVGFKQRLTMGTGERLSINRLTTVRTMGHSPNPLIQA